MKIEQLKYLIEIGHSRSISSAAGKLYLSHTTLSSILKGAEKNWDSLCSKEYRGA